MTTLEVLKKAREHVTELDGAWLCGAISEHDGKGGTRSNRNWDVMRELDRTIEALEKEAEDETQASS